MTDETGNGADGPRVELIDASSAKPAPFRGVFFEFLHGLAWLYHRLTGWRAVGDWPGLSKAVLVAAPHTSNWDGLNMLSAAGHYRIRLDWMGKKSLTTGPFGWFIKWLGCVPVDRSSKNDVVRQMADAFAARKRLILAIPPEGTRGKGEGWKTGFYHIAVTAGVPIIISVLDYKKKTMRLAAVVHPTGDYARDLPVIAAFYEGAVGKKPELFSMPEV